MPITQEFKTKLSSDEVEDFNCNSSNFGEEQRINDDDTLLIIKAIQNNKKLTKFEFRPGIISPANFKSVIEAIKNNQTITFFDSSYWDQRSESRSIHPIADLLATNKTIREIVLKSNKLGKNEISVLANALKNNHTLASLEVSSNNIGTDGAAIIADVLKNNTTLADLDLSHNNIGDAGAIAIAEALKNNHTLTKINFAGNNITGIGVRAIASMLKANGTLARIDLEEHNFDDASFVALADALKINRVLSHLALDHTNFDNGGASTELRARAFSDAIEANRTLRELKLPAELSMATIQSLAKGLAVNNSLASLQLGSESIFSRLFRSRGANRSTFGIAGATVGAFAQVFLGRPKETPENEVIASALKNNKNIAYVYPANRRLTVLCEVNREAAQALIEKLQTSNIQDLRPNEIKAIGERIPAILMMQERGDIKFPKETIATLLGNAQRRGIAIGVNIELPPDWQQLADAMLGGSVFRSSAPPPTKIDRNLTLSRLLETKPSGKTNLQIFAEQGQLGDVFTAEIWQGRRGEMDKAWDAVPPKYRGQVNIDQVRIQIGITEGRARFSTGSDDREQGL